MAQIKEERERLAPNRDRGQGGRLRPKKGLGQHFLIDRGVVDRIIASARFLPGDLVVEIGPGRGALTLPLARRGLEVVAVEKDVELVRLLKERLTRLGISNVTLLNQDFLTFDFSAVTSRVPHGIQVVGNIPYNISSPILEKVIRERDVVARAVLMFQLEVARRLTSDPGTKAYGAMTLLIRYHARVTPLFTVPRRAFYPVPRVDSMVVELDLRRPYPARGVSEGRFRRVVKGAFAHRRKTLVNSMRGFVPSWTRDFLVGRMESIGIDPVRRAETLDMDEFLDLALALDVDSG